MPLKTLLDPYRPNSLRSLRILLPAAPKFLVACHWWLAMVAPLAGQDVVQ